jgi:anti-sigma B factor antagonist
MANFNVTGVDHVTLVEASGRIDSMTANELGTAINDEIDNGNIHIVLDLSGVDYMSSAGLRELVSSLKRVKRVQGDVRIADPSPRVREVLEMAGLDTIFLIFQSQTEALESY